ncbi:MAG: amino acid permease [Rhizobiales bacterium]|nr:amino acid permease [Hyphomicrobiales bacterium]
MSIRRSGTDVEGGPRLERALTLPLVVLYGLGVTIGAGIYVLIGATAARAGLYAPISFVVAALAMLLSAASFAELSGRHPVSAGEAAYVRAGFGSRRLSLLVGLAVVTVGCVSAAAIALGSVGYIAEITDLPHTVLVLLVILAMGLIASVGILESVAFAGFLTLLEVAGLLFIIAGGIWGGTRPEVGLEQLLAPPFEAAVWSGILGAGLLAFFAFIGFEDLVNIAEEVERPERTMPLAIFLTLGISTVLYVLVVTIAVLAVAPDDLAATPAPLSLVFERTTGLPPLVITSIAIVATLNGVIVQMIMASRVIYGLADQASLPSALAKVHARTRTPLRATALIVAVILALALLFPLERLAEVTSSITLMIFTLVNLSLVLIKQRGEPAPAGTMVVPGWVPPLGALVALALLVAGWFA